MIRVTAGILIAFWDIAWALFVLDSAWARVVCMLFAGACLCFAINAIIEESERRGKSVAEYAEALARNREWHDAAARQMQGDE